MAFRPLTAKAVFCFFIPILLFQSAPAQPDPSVKILKTGSHSITFRVDVPEVHLQKAKMKGVSYLVPSIPGYGFHIQPGDPALPQKAFTFGAPPEATVRLEIVERVERETRPLGFKILPAPGSGSELNEGDRLSYEFNEGPAYKVQTWVPNRLARVQETGIVREQRMVSVIVSPLQYNPAAQQVRIYAALVLRLIFYAEKPRRSQGWPTSGIHAASPAFESLLSKTIVNHQQARAWRSVRPMPEQTLREVTGPVAAERCRIGVREDGLYQITGADLLNLGFDLNSIDPATLILTNKGQEIPIKLFGAQDRRFDPADFILFAGRFNRGEKTYLSPYSGTNVYWLSRGGEKGLRMAEVDGGLYEGDSTRFAQPRSYRTIAHFEQDWLFHRLLLVNDEKADHWFWQRMDAGRSYETKFRLEYPVGSNGPAVARLALHGSTHPLARPDHHVLVSINGRQIGDVFWDGQNELTVENDQIPTGILRHGENRVTFQLPGDTEAGEIDQVFLNWLEIEYDKRFKAENDGLEIQWQEPGLTQFVASGFTRPDVFIVDSFGRNIINYELRKSGGGYVVSFQDRPPFVPCTYHLFTPARYMPPDTMVMDEPSNLRSAQNGADYLIITHPTFAQACLPLEQQRAKQGLRVRTINIQDIYDEFNHGIYDPRAIKDFLKYAYHNWISPAPTYVLLLGDHHFGFDKEVARSWEKISYVPTYMAYTTSWGVTSSDNYFVTVSGNDDLPDMFIGRLPVNSVEEAEVVINKIVRYESQPDFGEWRKTVALSAGNNSFFEDQVDVLDAEFIPEDYFVPRLYTNPHSPYFGSTKELLDIFNRGAVILNFSGHGGGGVFFDSELFLLEDILLLNNSNRLPVALSWSCFIGYFDNPFSPSLGEELLLVPDRGVVAHFGSAGRAWLFGDFFFNQAFFKSLFRDRQRTLGQVATAAKVQLLSLLGAYKDMADNYILLGDPALEIGLPQQPIAMDVSTRAEENGLQITGTLSDASDGQVRLSFSDEQDSLISSKEVEVRDGGFDALIPFEKLTEGSGKIRAYFWNETTDGSGAAFYSVEPLQFSDEQLIPRQPLHSDTVHFSTKLTLHSQKDSLARTEVSCEWSWDRSSWRAFPLTPMAGEYRSEAGVVVSGGKTLFYKFSAIMHHTHVPPDTISSHLFSSYIPKRPDLTVPYKSVRVAGTGEIQLLFTVQNKGETDARHLAIRLQEISAKPDSKSWSFETALQNIPAQKDTLITVYWPVNSDDHRIQISLDPENTIDEMSEFNNTIQKGFRILSTSNGTGGPVTGPDSLFLVDIPPHSVDRNTSLDIRPKGKVETDPSASGLVPVSFKNRHRAIYEIGLDDTLTAIKNNFRVGFKMPSLDSSETEHGDAQIYLYRNDEPAWQPLPTVKDWQDSTLFSDRAVLADAYGLFFVRDQQPPFILMKVNGQWFTEGDYVPDSPEFSVVIADSSGLPGTPNKIKLLLDSQVVSLDDYSLGYSNNRPRIMLLNYSPSLHSGDHSLSVMAEDVHGNATDARINFQVSGDFRLQSLANHPNPFSNRTIIAYTLTNEAESTEIKIYTISGQLIRVFQFFNEVGYVEHEWDGTDDFGNELANGVYYLRFGARSGENRIQTIQKLAKLK